MVPLFGMLGHGFVLSSADRPENTVRLVRSRRSGRARVGVDRRLIADGPLVTLVTFDRSSSRLRFQFGTSKSASSASLSGVTIGAILAFRLMRPVWPGEPMNIRSVAYRSVRALPIDIPFISPH